MGRTKRERESKVEGGAKIVYAMGEFLDEWPGGGKVVCVVGMRSV